MLQRLSAALVFLTALLAGTAQAAEFFVSPQGSDLRGNGSRERPWGSVGYGAGKLDSGDTLTVMAGFYEGREHFIPPNTASGKPGSFTTIRAESPMSVRIRYEGSTLDYNENLAHIKGSYIHVDGFIFELRDSRYPPYAVRLNGNHLKLTRSIVKRTGELDPYGGLVNVGGHTNLLEDVAGVGVCRYCFYTGGPKDDDHKIIFRRVVGRFDYANSDQPKATFAAYGNNSGHKVRDILMQNVIALDGNDVPIGNEKKYGGIYAPKNTAGLTVQGSIVLNEGTRYAGMFVQELSGRDTRVEHSVVWDLKGEQRSSGVRENGSGADHFSNLTIGGRMTGKALYSRQGRSAEHSLLKPLPAQLENLLDNAPKGAQVLYQYGRSGTLWGEPGFDELTDMPLWPWPYEAAIRAVFSEPHSPPQGYMPVENQTRRGFTVARDQFNQPMSLTRYVWQYLGKRMPADIYPAN